MQVEQFEFWLNAKGCVLSFDAPHGWALCPNAILVTRGGGGAWLHDETGATVPLAGGLSPEEVIRLLNAERVVAAVKSADDDGVFDLSVRAVAPAG